MKPEPTTRRLRHLVIPLAIACALAAPAVASANAKLRVGFLDNAYASTYPGPFWSEASDLNVGFMRWDLQWKHVAPTKPRSPRDPADPAYNWTQTDAFVRNAVAAGLQDNIMFTLWATPRWASKTPNAKGYTATMPKLADWKAFAYAAATRYSGTFTPVGATAPLPRVTAWEAWNEPNGYFALRPQFQDGVAVSPRNYTALLNAMGAEVRQAVPFTPTIVAGALYKTGGRNSVNPIDFLRGMRQAGARFTVLSVHPYNKVAAKGVRDGATQSRTNPAYIAIGNLDAFVALANQIFGRRYPVWVTEFGWNTPAPRQRQTTVSFAQQATFVSQSIARMRQIPQVERLAWFLLRDDNPKPAGKWYTTGLRKLDDSPKPSYGAWKRAAAGLQGIG
ncbi:MAG: hypothetical protein RL190_1551 [Actinomycetota bacterium]